MLEAQTDSSQEGYQLSAVVVPLLRGVIYQQENGKIWNALLSLQGRVRDYVAVLDLDLVLDEAEGYAFLRSRPVDPENKNPIPRLVRRQQLSFPVSLLLALLRKKMAEFDATDSDGEMRLVLDKEEIMELIRVFMPDSSNESRLTDQFDTLLNKITKLGFIKPLKGQKNTYEVRRILKAFIDAQWLTEFDQQLAVYQKELAQQGEENG